MSVRFGERVNSSSPEFPEMRGQFDLADPWRKMSQLSGYNLHVSTAILG